MRAIPARPHPAAAAPGAPSDGVPLRRLLDALGTAYLQVLHAPESEPTVREMVIVEPEDRSEPDDGDLVFLVGVRGDAAVPAFERIARGGAAAIAVKGDATSSAALRDAARRLGAAALLVHPEMQWEQLGSMVADILGSTLAGAPEHSIDLFTLAQTISTIAGGPVSIEGVDFRVLAYSTQGDEVDDLRRLSILGRQGPLEYLRTLTDLGVYERLRRGEEIVVVSEHPELGIKARLALGVNYGSRHLGVIWVQREESPESAEQRAALLGAARLVAQLIASGHRSGGGPALFRNDVLEGLLDGRGEAAELEAAPGAVVVAVFELAPNGPFSDGKPIEDVVVGVANLIAVQAESFRRQILMTTRHGRVVVALPGAGASDVGWLESLAGRVVVAQDRFSARIRAGVGEPAADARGIPASYRSAREVLALLAEQADAPLGAGAGAAGAAAAGAPAGMTGATAASPAAAVRTAAAGSVGTADGFRNRLLVRRALAALGEELRHPPLEALAADQPETAGTLLDFLSSGGRYSAVAQADGVHVNTVRYRVRRGAEAAGLDLDDPDHRFAAELVLRKWRLSGTP